MNTYGTLIGPNGFRYTFTDEDVLWSARMLIGESGSLAWTTNEGYAMLWTMANRFVLRTLKRGDAEKKTFWEFIRTFSQPINPIWYNAGSRDEDPTVVSPEERRRAQISAISEAELKSKYQPLLNIILRFVTGDVPVGPYVGLVDFTMPGYNRNPSNIGPVDLPNVSQEENVFFRQPDSVSWNEDTVRILPPSSAGSVASSVGRLGLGVFIGLVGLYFVLRFAK